MPQPAMDMAGLKSSRGAEYSESNETFIRSDIFASTSNVFAEELTLGPEYISEKVVYVPLDFTVYELPSLKEVNQTKGTGINAKLNDQTKGTGINVQTMVPEINNQTKVPETNANTTAQTKVPEINANTTAQTKVPEINNQTMVPETTAQTKVPETTALGVTSPTSPASPVAVVTPTPAKPAKPARKGLLAAASALAAGREIKLEEVEELPSTNSFSMTQFGANLAPVQDLESAPQESIVENNGLFQIATDLEYSEVKHDKSFQSLVDSVLK